MKRIGLRLPGLFLLLLLCSLLLGGCWDYHELEDLFIVTGVGLDQAESPEKVEVVLQIGKTRATNADVGEAGFQDSSSIVLRTVDNTVIEGITKLNRSSSRTLLLHHNQVMLLGSALAEAGVESRIDAFMRNQEMRMEVLVMVADRRAGDILAARLGAGDISGIYLYDMMQDLYNISPYYKVRTLDFVSRLREGTSSPVAPIVKLEGPEDKQEIKLGGLAVFKRDKMVGRLSPEEMEGYILAMGSAKQGIIAAETALGRAVFHIAKLTVKREISFKPEGGVRGVLTVHTAVGLAELRGFREMTPLELMPCLMALAEDQIRRQILDTFQAAQKLEADIYGFASDLRRHHSKAWKTAEGQWERLFREMELEVRTKIRLLSTGQIAQSLKMEADNHED
jgi:spore germination protein KC